MVKARGACTKPFWTYERLNNCAAPAPDSDDVLAAEAEAFLCVGHAKKATTKTFPFTAKFHGGLTACVGMPKDPHKFLSGPTYNWVYVLR